MPRKRREDTEEAIDANPALENALKQSGAGKDQNVKRTPSYRVFGDLKIAVSKKQGKLWKHRWKQGMAAQKKFEDAWNEAEKYYNNDQMSRREGDGPEIGNRNHSNQIRQNITETENIVYANTSTLVPTLYARNPIVEFTATKDENKPLATAYERLINTLFSMKEAPGINIKQPLRRMALNTQLSNICWLEIGWTEKQESIDNALQDLDSITKRLAETKETKEIIELEGKLMAIERNVEVLQPEGFFRRVRRGKDVVVDPAAEEVDLSDANWVAIKDYVSTEWLIARFFEKESDGQFKSLFEPTHVLPVDKLDTTGEEIDEEDFQLITEGDEASAVGFDDQESFKHAQRTCVWHVWDKVTRRVYLFHSRDWTWPIWVWNDPYKLLNFYPIFGLQFHAPTSGKYSKGEVTYYLDQQDAINEINSEERLARLWARFNVFFDKEMGVSREDVQAMLHGASELVARGVDVPEGKKLDDMLGSVVPPSMNFPELFDISKKLQAISRISAVNEAVRGGEFRTNTTNDAIETYNTSQGIRIDEKTDAIEDMLGDVAWSMAQMLGQKMSKERVIQLIGKEVGEAFTPLEPEQFRSMFRMRVVGGSTVKPTSHTKRREALEVGQVLGQFTNSPAAPVIVLIVLEMFRQAFDSINIKDEQWQVIQQAMTQALQGAPNGQPNPQAQGANGGTAGGNQPPTQGQQTGEPGVSELLGRLPDDLKQQIALAISQGSPTQ